MSVEITPSPMLPSVTRMSSPRERASSRAMRIASPIVTINKHVNA
jgi:hypothetical protein